MYNIKKIAEICAKIVEAICQIIISNLLTTVCYRTHWAALLGGVQPGQHHHGVHRRHGQDLHPDQDSPPHIHATGE